MKKLLFLSLFLMGGFASTAKCADPAARTVLEERYERVCLEDAAKRRAAKQRRLPARRRRRMPIVGHQRPGVGVARRGRNDQDDALNMAAVADALAAIASSGAGEGAVVGPWNVGDLRAALPGAGAGAADTLEGSPIQSDGE